MSEKPLKRNESMQPYSREHHHSLLLCWKLKQGLAKGVDLERMKKFIDWSWKTRIQPHFEAEEKYMFPVLPADDPMIVQSLNEHRTIEGYFTSNDLSEELFENISVELDEHIRFEERVLFNRIQEAANEEELKLMEKHHAQLNSEDYEDEFWK